jgi:hypothetical protein
MVVFEVVMANDKPFRKRGLFKDARFRDGALTELTNSVNAESIPLLTQHDGNMLAVGRLFAAMRNSSEARGLIAVSSLEHPEMVAKLDSGTLDQVSVGVLPKSLTCSACGFDYMGPDATWEHFGSNTCPDGHTIGENGVHTFIESIDMFFELSVVNKGGVPGAKVMDKTNSVFSRSLAALAASSGREVGALAPFVLQLEATGDDLKPDAFAIALKSVNDANGVIVAGLNAQVSTLTTSVSTLTASVDAATAKGVADVAAVTAQLTAAQAVSAAISDTAEKARLALLSIAKKTTVALGSTDTVSDTETIDKLLEIVEAGQVKLAAIFPTGGVANKEAAKVIPNRSNAAFMSKKG